MLHEHGIVYIWIQVAHIHLKVALLALRCWSFVGGGGRGTHAGLPDWGCCWTRVKGAPLALGESRGQGTLMPQILSGAVRLWLCLLLLLRRRVGNLLAHHGGLLHHLRMGTAWIPASLLLTLGLVTVAAAGAVRSPV